MLSRRKFFGFIAAAPVALPAIVKAASEHQTVRLKFARAVPDRREPEPEEIFVENEGDRTIDQFAYDPKSRVEAIYDEAKRKAVGECGEDCPETEPHR